MDHFQPQSLAPNLRIDYFNLVYACRACNSAKLDQSVDDPLEFFSSESVLILPDGSIASDKRRTRRLIRQLDLNSPKIKRWRVKWMRIISLAKERDAKLYAQLTGFPDDLPNLAGLRPPSNSRPDGIEISWYAKRQRRQLPETY